MNKRFVCQHCQTTYPDFDVAHVCSRGPYAPKLKLKKNERIRELAEQAGLKHHNWITNESNVKDGDFKYPRLEDYEKFAELIVRECASEYNKLINGEAVVLPKDREHAEALVRVGMFYLENNK